MHLVNLFQFRTAVATIALSIGLIGAQSDAAIPKIVQDASVKVQSSVAHFQQSHSLADLQTAINTMYGTIQQHTLTPANFVETRRTLARSCDDPQGHRNGVRSNI